MTSILSGARVLVTGASGFIGRPLVEALARAGAEVHGTSRVERQGTGLRWWRCDLTDTAAVRACFAQSRPDYIVHLSSRADGRRDRQLVIDTLQSETVAAVNVIDAAVDAGTRRIILPASLEEPAPGEVPSSPYAAAKAASHLYERLYRHLYAAPTVMVRIYMAYGPGQPEWKLIPATVRRMMRGERAIIDSPDRLLDWIYIADVVDGLLAVLKTPYVDDEPIDLGSGRLIAIRDIVTRLQSLTGCVAAPDFSGAAARGNDRLRTADLERSLRLTGWSPAFTLEQGLELAVAALRQ